MISTSSEEPRPQRRLLGNELRRLRKLAGLSGRAISAQIGIGQTSVSRVENAQQLLSLPETMKWADAVMASDEQRATLVALTEAALNEVETWRTRQRNEGLAAIQADVAELEAATQSFRIFQPSIVPGLLQTPAYARQIFALTNVVGNTDYDAAVSMRTQRQQILYDETRQFEFVLTEGALRWRAGTPSTLIAQLDRITTLANLSNVDVGVIPDDASPPTIAWVGFNLYDDIQSGGIPAIATIEVPHARLTISDPADVEIYREQFAQLRQAAHFGEDAVAHIAELIDSTRSTSAHDGHANEPQRDA